MNLTDKGLTRIVLIVAILNLTYFGVEFAVAQAIGSVSLFEVPVTFWVKVAVLRIAEIRHFWHDLLYKPLILCRA